MRVAFDGLFYNNIPRLSHNGMENARTTMKFVYGVDQFFFNIFKPPSPNNLSTSTGT